MPARKKSPAKNGAEAEPQVIDEFGQEAVQLAVEAFKNGEPIMVFDSAFRERFVSVGVICVLLN
jgi:hypothetical protein